MEKEKCDHNWEVFDVVEWITALWAIQECKKCGAVRRVEIKE